MSFFLPSISLRALGVARMRPLLTLTLTTPLASLPRCFRRWATSSEYRRTNFSDRSTTPTQLTCIFPNEHEPPHTTATSTQRTSTPADEEQELSVQDYLLQVEQDLELFFRNLAERAAATPGIQRILLRLAEDEAKAYDFLENMRISSVALINQEQELRRELKHVFATFHIEDLTSDDRDQIKVYMRARDAKGRLRDMYQARAVQCQDSKARMLFDVAAREAGRHFDMLDETVEYLGKAEPGAGRWATCQEFFFVDQSQFEVSLDKY